jgi:hypothetical protein
MYYYIKIGFIRVLFFPPKDFWAVLQQIKIQFSKCDKSMNKSISATLIDVDKRQVVTILNSIAEETKSSLEMRTQV